MLEVFLEVFLDALKDSAIVLPVIFICYLLIELLEEKILNKYQSSNLLKGKFAPVISAGFGLIPQCGFSVVATDLYSRRVITLGSLFAIYIATSDEALPLMLSSPENYGNLLIILAIKLVYAILVGLSIDFIFRKKLSNKKNVPLVNEEIEGCCKHKLEHEHNKFKEIIFHPFIHSLKIFAFILVINIIFGLIISYVGEDSISNFMLSTGFFEPFIVSLVGLIPNCAASVIVTEMFLNGSIAIGSCIAGLCVNSGIAIIVLFRLNKNVKENLMILLSLYLLSCLIGVVINFF